MRPPTGACTRAPRGPPWPRGREGVGAGWSAKLLIGLAFRLLGVGGDLHLDDLVGVGDGTVAGRVALLDLVDIVHAGHHRAPDRVLTVKEGRGCEHNEELAVGTVWVGGPRHRDGAAHVLLVRKLGS